jgi:hypothetical protein
MVDVNILPIAALQVFRARTFRTAPGQRVTNRDEAVEFVNARGFVYFWPIRETLLPSLWVAVAGDRPVADEHDDPGHVTWGWKDSLLGSRAWYYAKVLRKRATMIAIAAAPYFYALSDNFGAPEEDYLTLYEQGRLTLESKTLFEVLLDKGPLDTVALRREAHMTSQESDARFNKALADLQAGFKIIPVRVAQAGAWNYAFVYDLVHRVYPELLDQARYIGELDARQKLAELYFRSVGSAQLRDLIRLFGWQPPEAEQVVERLIKAGVVQRDVKIEGQPGEWILLAELLAP